MRKGIGGEQKSDGGGQGTQKNLKTMGAKLVCSAKILLVRHKEGL